MTHVFPLLPALGCMAMMFGAGALARLMRPLRRVPSLARRARQTDPITPDSADG